VYVLLYYLLISQEIYVEAAMIKNHQILADVIPAVTSQYYCTYERICAVFALRANFSLVG